MPGKTILIVDDEPHVQQVLRIRLESVGYRVEVANDGLEALSMIRQAQPDLVILDIMMPKMDGYTMIQTLRKYEQGAGLKPIPVIILSVKQEKKMRDLMFFEGVAGYVEKPFEAANLLKKIREAISTS